jgi:hypothetical protein
MDNNNKINYKTILEESKLRLAADLDLIKLCIEMFPSEKASQRLISYMFSTIDLIEQRIRMVENCNQLEKTTIGSVCPKCKNTTYIYFPESKSFYCQICDLMHKKVTI